jgi:hypothetical protein
VLVPAAAVTEPPALFRAHKTEFVNEPLKRMSRARLAASFMVVNLMALSGDVVPPARLQSSLVLLVAGVMKKDSVYAAVMVLSIVAGIFKTRRDEPR